MSGNVKNADTKNRVSSGSKPKLTEAERHKRFVETAKKVEASENIEDFDKAFGRIIKSISPKN